MTMTTDHSERNDAYGRWTSACGPATLARPTAGPMAEERRLKTIRQTLPATVVALALACLCLLAGAPASAQDDYSATATLTVDRPTLSCGEVATLTGVGFLVDADVTLSYGGATIGVVHTDANGNFVFPWTTPAGLTGPQVVRAVDGANDLNVSLTLTCGGVEGGGGGGGGGASGGSGSAGGGSGGGGGLPATGSDRTGPMLRLGVLLLGAGALLVTGTKRRTREA
jgi:uncharacterized membrane protein YgcG